MRFDPSILWTSAEAAVITGGASTGEWSATGLAISMNDLRPGDLYVATQEDNLDEVFRKGAVAAIVTGNRESASMPLLKVENVFEALLSMAGAARYRTHATIISVQGREARGHAHEWLARAGTVHDGGRHLSLGLANIPENVDFGLFAASPFVQPDIVIITNCKTANRDTLFETMPVNGTAIINADDEDFLSIVARARAACISNILTYGKNTAADACLSEIISAGNGTRISARILGEELSIVLPPGDIFHTSVLGVFLALKLTNRSLPQAVSQTNHSIFPPAENGVTLIDPALRGRDAPQAVFRVTNIIDLGFGRQTAVLDNIGHAAPGAISLSKKDLAIPRKIASLDFVYTSKKVGAVTSAHEMIREKYRAAKLEQVTPEVASPGDFLVFKNVRIGSQAIFSEVLRLMPDFKKKKVKHAL